MDFRLNSEQAMLRDGARRFVADNLDFDARAGKAGEAGCHWAAIAELGWLMLPVPEDCDGLGGGLDDIAIVAEELGRGLALEPFVEAGLLPARLIALAGTADQRQAWLPALAMGEMRFAVALYEPHRGFDIGAPQSSLTASAAGFSLSGTKIGIEAGDRADRILVSVRSDDGPALVLVDAHADGVQRIDYDAIDGRQLSDFIFADVAVASSDRLPSRQDDIHAAVGRAMDEAIVAQCAEALGGMERAIELTADYLKIRRQFGQPLADFQALQHGVANLFIEANDARSILYRAISMIDAPEAERVRAVSGCKVKVMEAARSVTGACVHYHGGIGVTTEYRVGHYLRRALMLEQRFGNAAHHFERLVETMPDTGYRPPMTI